MEHIDRDAIHKHLDEQLAQFNASMEEMLRIMEYTSKNVEPELIAKLNTPGMEMAICRTFQRAHDEFGDAKTGIAAVIALVLGHHEMMKAEPQVAVDEAERILKGE